MKFCAPHWQELKQAVKAKGMWDLVPTSHEEVVGQLLDDLSGVEKTLERFDPLMTSYLMITVRAIECGGIDILVKKCCPLCELEKHTFPGKAQQWIDKATQAAADHAKKLPRKDNSE